MPRCRGLHLETPWGGAQVESLLRSALLQWTRPGDMATERYRDTEKPRNMQLSMRHYGRIMKNIWIICILPISTSKNHCADTIFQYISSNMNGTRWCPLVTIATIHIWGTTLSGKGRQWWDLDWGNSAKMAKQRGLLNTYWFNQRSEQNWFI